MGEVAVNQVILVPEVSLDQVLLMDEIEMPTLEAETSPNEENMEVEENGVAEETEEIQEDEQNGGIDPAELLKELSPCLGLKGEIKGTSEVADIKEKMQESTKLVTKCVFTNILRATSDSDVLNAFIAAGGWDLLNDWLQDAKNTNNDAFITELLKVYSQMPITVSLLKQNSCAKTIKQLKSKSENPALKTLATELVDKWMNKIRQSGDSSNGSSSSEKSKKRKSGHKDKDSKGESSSSSSRKSSKPSDVKHRDSPEKDATPFLNGSSGTKKSEPSKPRAKTVKTVPTKFRSTGLEQETVLPPSRKKTTEKDSKSIPVKRPSLSLPKTPPEKRPRPALPSPIPSSTASSTSPVEKKGGIKLIPPRPKPVQVYESAGFMDALTTINPGPLRRKRKGSGSGKPNTPTSPPGTKQPSVPSFYQETLEHTEEEGAEKDDSKSSEADENEAPSENADKESVEGEAKEADGPPVPKKKKKKVSWVEESQLKQYFYFELDETERVNVNRAKDFASSIKQEMMMERQNVESAKRHHGQDQPVEYMTWRRPRPISGLTNNVVHGCNSTEKDKQKEREQGVLQAIFFTRATIPDTPADPEPEAFDHEDPKTIPLEDETGGAGETVYDSYPAPVETPVPTTATLSLPPDVASYLASMAQQTQNANQQPTMPDYQTSQHQVPQQHSYPNQHGQYVQGMGVQNPIPQGLMNTAPPPNYRGYPPPHHGPPPPRVSHPPVQGMPRVGEEEWGENMHGGPMMPPRGHPPPGMPPRGYRGMGPPRGMQGPHRGRGPPPGPRPPPVCRHFTSPSGCRFEQDCRFLHPGVNGPPL